MFERIEDDIDLVDIKVKNMGKQKLYYGICQLVQICLLGRGYRQKLFRYLR